MKKIDIKDVKMKVNESANAFHITFETKDGTTVHFIDTHDFEGFVADDDITNTMNDELSCRYLEHELDLYNDPWMDWDNWMFEADKYLNGFGMGLGALHFEPNGRVYDLIDLADF